MSSCVLDLQQELLNPNCDILNALRKAHVIASRLNLKEFDAWITSELNGYSEVDIPDYRKVKGSLCVFDWNMICIPVSLDSELQKLLCTRQLSNPISELIELFENTNEYFMIGYPLDVEREINQLYSAPNSTRFSLEVGIHVLKSIIDQVQNCLLEWTLRLESEGILGENMQFSSQETFMARNVPQTINNYYGTVVNGDIKQLQVVSGDRNTVLFNYQQAENLIQKIKEVIQNEQMSDEDREDANKLIAEAESKIAAQVKPSIFKATLSGLKDFLIGSGANVAGALIVEYLQQII